MLISDTFEFYNVEASRRDGIWRIVLADNVDFAEAKRVFRNFYENDPNGTCGRYRIVKYSIVSYKVDHLYSEVLD